MEEVQVEEVPEEISEKHWQNFQKEYLSEKKSNTRPFIPRAFLAVAAGVFILLNPSLFYLTWKSCFSDMAYYPQTSKGLGFDLLNSLTANDFFPISLGFSGFALG